MERFGAITTPANGRVVNGKPYGNLVFVHPLYVRQSPLRGNIVEIRHQEMVEYSIGELSWIAIVSESLLHSDMLHAQLQPVILQIHLARS